MPNLSFANNVTIQNAPPAYFIPNAAGVALPAGLTSFVMNLDLANWSTADTLAFIIEYSYDGGTTWREDFGASMPGGSFTTKAGGSTSVHSVTTGIPQNPYPQRARFRVDTATGSGRVSITGVVT